MPARSPNLNAFAERFQGSVLHLHTTAEIFYADRPDLLELKGWNPDEAITPQRVRS